MAVHVGALGLAHAAPSARLIYVRGPGADACADEAGFRAAVRNRVGYDPFFPTARRSVVLRFDRVGDRAAPRFRSRLEILGDDGVLLGEKTFEEGSDDCQELVRTVALAVSLAIDVEDAPTALPDEPPVPPPSETQLSPVIEARPFKPSLPTAARPRPAFAWRGEAYGLVRGSVGIARGPSMGVGLGAALGKGPWSLGFEGRYDVPSSSDLTPRGDLAVGLVAGSLVPCGAYRFLFGCLPVTLGSLEAASRGVERPARDRVLFWSIGARAGAELGVLPALAFRLSLDLLIVPERHEVQLGGAEVWRTPLLAASLNAAAVARF